MADQAAPGTMAGETELDPHGQARLTRDAGAQPGPVPRPDGVLGDDRDRLRRVPHRRHRAALGPSWPLFWVGVGIVVIGGLFGAVHPIFDDWY